MSHRPEAVPASTAQVAGRCCDRAAGNHACSEESGLARLELPQIRHDRRSRSPGDSGPGGNEVHPDHREPTADRVARSHRYLLFQVPEVAKRLPEADEAYSARVWIWLSRIIPSQLRGSQRQLLRAIDYFYGYSPARMSRRLEDWIAPRRAAHYERLAGGESWRLGRRHATPRRCPDRRRRPNCRRNRVADRRKQRHRRARRKRRRWPRQRRRSQQ